ncbi:MAG: peptidoglycan DD-metalloendopeptidase family protein [Vicinamibacteria bacterium]
MNRAIAMSLLAVAFVFGSDLSSRASPGTIVSPQKTGSKQAPRGARKTRPRKPRAKATPTPALVPDDSASPVASPTPTAPLASPSEPESAKLARVRAKRRAVEQEIIKLQSQSESTLRDLDSIDLDLRLAAHQFEEAGLEFKATSRQLDATIRDVQGTKAKIDATRPRVLKSLAALSKLGELSYARLLFSLDDPADILRGYRYVSRIASADGDQIKEFKTSLARLSVLEEDLKKRTADNLDTRNRLADAQETLAARKSHRETRLADIARERELQEELAEEYKNREADVLRLIGESGEVAAGGESVQTSASIIPPFQGETPLRNLKGELPWPVGGTLVKKFGLERDPKFGTRTIQQGIEIDAFPEIEVKAVHAGRVVYADQFVGYGMLVIVDHGHREHTLYGRLGELRVHPGDDVAEGSLLGLLPNTRVTGSGLHFEVRVQGKPEDPLDWLKKP